MLGCHDIYLHKVIESFEVAITWIIFNNKIIEQGSTILEHISHRSMTYSTYCIYGNNVNLSVQERGIYNLLTYWTVTIC